MIDIPKQISQKIDGLVIIVADYLETLIVEENENLIPKYYSEVVKG